MPTVLITGAASGLGWELARSYHAAGYHLLLTDINANGLTARIDELGAERVIGLAGDITDPHLHQQLLQTCRERFGRLDVLINNAGITHRSPAMQTDPAVLRKVMAVDYQAPVELTLSALPLLRQSRGQIIAIGGDGKQAQHGRSTIGQVRGADWMAAQILQAQRQGRERLFPDRGSWLASLLWRIAPGFYYRKMSARFAGEMG